MDAHDAVPVVDRLIEELEFSVRTTSALANAGVRTVRELTERSPVDLLKRSGFGRKSLREVVEFLGDYGLCLRGSIPASPEEYVDGVPTPGSVIRLEPIGDISPIGHRVAEDGLAMCGRELSAHRWCLAEAITCTRCTYAMEHGRRYLCGSGRHTLSLGVDQALPPVSCPGGLPWIAMPAHLSRTGWGAMEATATSKLKAARLLSPDEVNLVVEALTVWACTSGVDDIAVLKAAKLVAARLRGDEVEEQRLRGG